MRETYCGELSLHELRIEIAHWSGAFVTETEASPVRRLKVQHGDDDIQLANGQILVVSGDHNPVLVEPRRSRRS